MPTETTWRHTLQPALAAKCEIVMKGPLPPVLTDDKVHIWNWNEVDAGATHDS